MPSLSDDPNLISKSKTKDERKHEERQVESDSSSFFSQGLSTLRIPYSLHRQNRAKLIQSILHNNKKNNVDNIQHGIILLEGGKQRTRHDTDHEPLFRQESYFHWVFGVSEADCYGMIHLRGEEVRTTLFVPQYGLDYEIFCGKCPSLEEMRVKYEVDRVVSLDDMAEVITKDLEESDAAIAAASVKDKEVNGAVNGKHQEAHQEDTPTQGEEKKEGEIPKLAKLHLLSGLNTDSNNFAIPAQYEGISSHRNRFETSVLFPSISECRVTKSDEEIEVMRYANYVSSMAHIHVMQQVYQQVLKSRRQRQEQQEDKSIMMMEYQLESLFRHHTYFHGGCRFTSYACICACGPNPSILHYGHSGRPNNGMLMDGDMALLDMGAEYHCYASDITCSFPLNAEFTSDQRMVYEAVLDAQMDVMNRLNGKGDVDWRDMHRVAERAVLRGLLRGGVLKGEEEDYDEDALLDEMIKADLGFIFMPHGLGHFIGIDTHDVGGYNTPFAPTRSTRPGLNKLRTSRILKPGMVITVEPGCYFIDALMDMALDDPDRRRFINVERLEDFRGFGGVRLEDDVVIVEDGFVNLTLCPRSVEEVMDVMRGGEWPPKVDTLPMLRRDWCRRTEDGTMERLSLN